MTPDEIERIARRLYADPSYRGRAAWQRPLARGLGIGERTLRRWITEDQPSMDQATVGLLRAAEVVADQLRMWDEPPDRLIGDRLVEVLQEMYPLPASHASRKRS